ncbi:hypothetical protein V6N11_076855 [Hibiscus sabdariffa]|uniref:Transketolase-like pyrimidine-binding domain-containing protein n=1 Tax=Hibiscus sabdariffa TaxID=183260 RepID=A0ABR2TBB3_9ROSI
MMTPKCWEDQRNKIENQLNRLESLFEENPRYLLKIQNLLLEKGIILKSGDFVPLLKSVEEAQEHVEKAQEHVELTFHSNSSKSTEVHHFSGNTSLGAAVNCIVENESNPAKDEMPVVSVDVEFMLQTTNEIKVFDGMLARNNEDRDEIVVVHVEGSTQTRVFETGILEAMGFDARVTDPNRDLVAEKFVVTTKHNDDEQKKVFFTQIVFERDEMLIELEQECLDIHRRKMETMRKSKTDLHQLLAQVESEIAKLVTVLREHSCSFSKGKVTLKQQKSYIRPILDELRKQRVKKFTENQSQIALICAEIANNGQSMLPFDPEIDECDFTIKKLGKLIIFYDHNKAWKRIRDILIYMDRTYKNHVHDLRINRRRKIKITNRWENALSTYTSENHAKATINHSQQNLTPLIKVLPRFFRGSMFLASSNVTLLKMYGNLHEDTSEEHNLRVGIGEHELKVHYNPGLIQHYATFFVFIDYMRAAIRNYVLSKYTITYVMSHVCDFLGKDGPTYQLVAHLASFHIMLKALMHYSTVGNENAGVYRTCDLMIWKSNDNVVRRQSANMHVNWMSHVQEINWAIEQRELMSPERPILSPACLSELLVTIEYIATSVI